MSCLYRRLLHILIFFFLTEGLNLKTKPGKQEISFHQKSVGHLLTMHLQKMWYSWLSTLSSLILENITEIKVNNPAPGYQPETACGC